MLITEFKLLFQRMLEFSSIFYMYYKINSLTNAVIIRYER